MNITDKITVNTQSSIRIDCGSVIRFDPWKIEGEPRDAAAVFLTHEHHDHFSEEDLAKVSSPDTVVIAPASMRKVLANTGVPAEKCVFVNPGDKLTAAGIVVEAVPAYNRLKPFHPKTNGWVGYVVDIDGERVYVAGDTDGLDENASLDIDVAMIPIGGKFTMNAAEAAKFINKMRPKVAIPIHFGNMLGSADAGEKFKDAVDDGIEVVFKL